MAEKKLPATSEKRRLLIDPAHESISVRRQCELVGISRSALYYTPVSETEENLRLMRLIDEQYTRTPFYGRHRMTAYLRSCGETVNCKRVRRLMRIMGLQAVYPGPRTTVASSDHKVYPYLLRGLAITHPNQVWSSDITYIPMRQ